MFYKRRDYSQVIGDAIQLWPTNSWALPVEGKTVLIIDDMIPFRRKYAGYTCKELKERKAEKVIVCCTFGSFTNGLEKFDEYYQLRDIWIMSSPPT